MSNGASNKLNQNQKGRKSWKSRFESSSQYRGIFEAERAVW